jgi:trypsin
MQVVFVSLIFFILLLRLKSDNVTTYICDQTSSCGCSSAPAVLSRIIGGEQVSSLSWGWAVGLYRANSYYCAGTLIASDLVVTAAHCMLPELTKLSEMTIIGGTNSLSNSDGNGQVRRVLETFVYPNYTVALKINDIAIIRLSTPFDMSSSGLAIVCLPNAVTAESIAKLEYPVPGTTLVVVGWGVTVYGDTDPSTSLQQVTVEAVAYDSSDCTTSEDEMVNVTFQLCAGVPGGGKGKK